VLLQSWGNFADYDLNAGTQRKRFQRLQIAIMVIGVVGTALALINQVFAPKDANGSIVMTPLSDWWFYHPWDPEKQIVDPRNFFRRPWVGWWLIHYVLLIIPILLTVLITALNRFKQGNKWLLLRASAEAIKREIFRYRARSGDYAEVANVAPTPGTPGNGTPAPPRPNPDQVLAQRVEDITRRAMRTEVNASALKPYDRDKGIPPHMDAARGGDDGLSYLSPERYVDLRLGDQLNYYRTKAIKHERQLKVIQWSIFIIGGVGSLLAAINQQVWIALTTAVAAALTSYLSYQQTESTLTKYNQAATDLNNVKAWWTALPPEEQAKQENVTTLVDHTEQVLQSELDGWVQQMQNALAELRKGQEKAPEPEETIGGDGPTLPPAATVQPAGGDQIVTDGERPTDEEATATEELREEDATTEEGGTDDTTTPTEETATTEDAGTTGEPTGSDATGGTEEPAGAPETTGETPPGG
jgi:hypothetical protein